MDCCVPLRTLLPGQCTQVHAAAGYLEPDHTLDAVFFSCQFNGHAALRAPVSLAVSHATQRLAVTPQQFQRTRCARAKRFGHAPAVVFYSRLVGFFRLWGLFVHGGAPGAVLTKEQKLAQSKTQVASRQAL